jgi:hypothetical protein
MKWLAVLLVGCSSEAFSAAPLGVAGTGGEGSDGDPDRIVDDGHIGADAAVEPDAVSSEDAGPEANVCDRRHLVLPGEPGAVVTFPGPDDPAGVVEVVALLAPGEGADVVRRGPEVPCGWQLSVGATGVHAQVTGSLDHHAALPVSGDWRRVRWEWDESESVLLVDGAEVSRQDASPDRRPCTGPTVLGAVSDVSGVPYGWDEGRVAELSVGASRWTFDEESGHALDAAGQYVGAVGPGVARECD